MDRIIELVVVLLKQLDGLGVGHMAEVRVQHVMQPVKQTLVHKAVEEVHLLRRVFQHVGDDILQHILSQLHIVAEIGKRDLGLDHPEFRCVAGGIGVFRPEGGAEGVDIAEGHRKGLAVELTGDGQVCGLVEEVLGVIHRAVLVSGRVGKVERGDLEHLACALGVRAGDQRGVDVDKVALHEELMDGEGDQAAHAEHRLEGVGPGPQMGHGAQIFQRVALGLDGEVRRGGTLHGNCLGLDLKGLLCLGRGLEDALDDQRRTDVDLGDLGKVLHLACDDHLHRLEISAVREHHKAKRFGGPAVADPSTDFDGLAGICLGVAEKLPHGDKLFHVFIPAFFCAAACAVSMIPYHTTKAGALSIRNCAKGIVKWAPDVR